MSKKATEQEDSFKKGAKIALGIIFIFIAFFWLFKPTVIVGPMDSEGNIIVPKGTSQNIAYSSIPIKESDSPLDDNKVKSCGNGICEEDESMDTCNSDCKGPTIKINDWDLKHEIGEVPGHYDSEMADEMKATYVSTAQDGKIFLILDLTIDNTNSNEVYLNLYYIGLKDKEGYIYRPSHATYRLVTPLPGDDYLEKDDKVSGKIAFEIPKNKREFQFNLDIGSDSVSINVDLNK